MFKLSGFLEMAIPVNIMQRFNVSKFPNKLNRESVELGDIDNGWKMSLQIVICVCIQIILMMYFSNRRTILQCCYHTRVSLQIKS